MTASATEVDIGRLRTWMQVEVPGLAVQDSTPIRAARVGGGFSNLTFEITLGEGDTARHLILRRPPVGVRADRGAHDMRRGVPGANGGRRPAGTGADADCTVRGRGRAGRAVLPDVQGAGVAVRTLDDAPALRDPTVMRRMSESCIDALAALHALPVTGLPMYDAAKVDGYGARQVHNWAARWMAVRPPDVPDADAATVFAWLAEYLPAPLPPALLHNDWKFDNLLVDRDDPSVICGVLDWEMATIGDPRFDLATSLGYWVQSDDAPMLQALALGVTNAPGCLTREQVVARYVAARGVPVDDPVYWWVFGLAKVAVIVLQLYARYVAGTTQDARFAFLGGMAGLLMSTARSAIDRNSLAAH
ncbi:MAG: phosphotransferase family protein [Gemmatimonadaceae bacterium]|nr:phosphotransferase family protein [Gemmatimonadaceae bacterium]